MARPGPADYLQPDERVVGTEGRHRLSVVDELLGVLLLAAVLVTGVLVATRVVWPQLWAPWGILALAATLAGLAMLALSRWWLVLTSLYTVTDSRVYKSYGRLRWTLLQTTFDKVTDLHVRQGIFGRMGGFGTVRLETAGTGLALTGVRDPFGFKQKVESARTAFLHTLVAQQTTTGASTRKAPGKAAAAGAPAPAKATPRRAGMGEGLWQGAPAGSSILARILGPILFGVLALAMLVAGLVGAQPQLLLMGSAFLLLGGIQVFAAVVWLRHTRYHVHEGGVVVTSGWLTRRRVETTYSKVTDVTTTQGLLGRLMGFGDIRINTAGSNEAPVVFQGIRDPEGLKTYIDQVRSA